MVTGTLSHAVVGFDRKVDPPDATIDRVSRFQSARGAVESGDAGDADDFGNENTEIGLLVHDRNGLR
jgi:hypothetical protein